jgi:hypothetical protein
MTQRTGIWRTVVLALASPMLACSSCSEQATNASTAPAKAQASDQPQDSLKPEPKVAPPAKPATPEKPADKPANAEKPVTPDKPANAEKKAEARPGDGKREVFSAENNPTTKAGRGAPDLDNPQSPAAWVYIDGKAGKFKEEGGLPLLQWFLEEPVGASPKFRVEAFEPLLGTPKDFKAVLRSVEPADGVDLVYGIAAKEGTFEVGQEYSLLNPGENFVIRNGLTGDVLKEISPLPSGKYAVAAGVINTATGKQSLAVTYFTVKSDE